MRERISNRAFLRQVADLLPSHLPPRLRDFSSEQWGRYFKLWYHHPKVHFEVQFLRNGRLEIGLHLEGDRVMNDAMAAELQRGAATIRRALGADVSFGAHGPGWRSVSETWPAAGLGTEDAAAEASARLGEYVTALAPLVTRASQRAAATPRARAARG